MSGISYLKKGEKCDNDRAKSADKGSHGGQKIKSGLFFKLTIGMGLLAIIGTVAVPTLKTQANDLQKIITAPIDQINSTQWAKVLNNQSADMSNQAEVKEKEIKGRIVEWDLEILVVANMQGHFKIVTKPTFDYPGALLTLYPQNNQQITYLENVKPGDRIKIKGKIAGILQGRIKINPALII